MAKSMDLFKKVGDNKGIFYEKIGTINNKNSMNLTEAEEIKKKWQVYTEKLYKIDLNDWDNHNGEVSHKSQRF